MVNLAQRIDSEDHPPVDIVRPSRHLRVKVNPVARDIPGLPVGHGGGVDPGRAAGPVRPRKRIYVLLAAGIVVGMVGAVRIGQIAAKRVMHVSPPGGLEEADAQAKAMGGPGWWIDRNGPAPLPPARLVDRDHREQAPTPVERTIRISKGDTLADLLLRSGASAPDVHDAVDAMRDVFDPRSIRPGLELTLTFGPGGTPAEGQLIKVSLPLGAEQTVRVERGDDDSFNASKIKKPLTREVVRTQGVIHSSLYEDGVAAGLSAPLLAELVHAFSYDVDFQREIQAGDRFEVAYERYTDGRDRVAKTGNIIYASLTLSDRTLKIYRYTPKGGEPDYFNEKGESVRKALLRTPVDGARLTSGFGMRVNPILGFSMMHKGVDFGAASGTPIMAAGDGTVEMAGWNGAYGNYVRVHHNSEYSTAYAHMSRIAKGLHKGSHVRQGQVIGYVGATGRATGPHLHYEVLVHNRQINPMNVKLPTGIKLAGMALKSFDLAKAKTDAQIAALPLATKVAKTGF
jgi:murein DD-endopeptidase MepM/ murein hydrolase activator NlpD